MGRRSDAPDPSEPTTVEPPPKRPVLEMIEGGAHWILEAYNEGHRDGETYSTHDTQMDALRAGKHRMDEDGHPCLLRWDSTDSVGTMYWNPDFEHLDVRRDPLTDQWVIVPAAGETPFYTTPRQELAARYARLVQAEYNFKHLDLYGPDGSKRRTIDHRFVRNEIDASGVRFDRDAAAADPTAEPVEEGDDEPGGVPTKTTPASALAAAVPDLTDIEVELSEGPIRRYRAGWTDGEALIAVLDPDLCDDRDVVDAFLETVEHWTTISENAHVATVHDDGIGPSPWVVYDAASGGLGERIDDLGLRARIDVADDVAAAYETATLYGVPLRGAAPSNVRLGATTTGWQGRLTDWGLTRAVARALGETPVTPFTAPEEVTNDRTDATPVYRLGALTYYLATRQEPFAGASSLSTAIRDGGPAAPSTVADLPAALDDVILQAMATDPADRYTRVEAFRNALADAL